MTGKFLLNFSSTAQAIIFVTAKQDILIKRRLNKEVNILLSPTQIYLYEKIYESLKRTYFGSKVYKLIQQNKIYLHLSLNLYHYFKLKIDPTKR
jgi:hypothetical protein